MAVQMSKTAKDEEFRQNFECFLNSEVDYLAKVIMQWCRGLRDWGFDPKMWRYGSENGLNGDRGQQNCGFG
jgi:hypothetical protein